MKTKEELKIIAKNYVIQNEYEVAIEYYNEIINIYGEDSQIYYYIALTYLNMGLLYEAIYYLEKSNELSKDTPFEDKYIYLIELLIEIINKDYPDPSEVDTLLLLPIGIYYMKEVNYNSAIMYLKELENRKNGRKLPFIKTNLLLFEAYLNIKDYKNASIYLQYLRTSKTNLNYDVEIKISELRKKIEPENKIVISDSYEYKEIMLRVLENNENYFKIVIEKDINYVKTRKYLYSIIKDSYLKGMTSIGDKLLEDYNSLPYNADCDKRNIKTLTRNKKLYLHKGKKY